MAAKAKPKKMSSKQMKKTKGGMSIPTEPMNMPRGGTSTGMNPPPMPKAPTR
jgi:hypothetical protein